MSDVKRYESLFLDPKSGEMASMRHVSEHDYDALLAENERLKRAAQTNWNEFAENVGELDQLRDELAEYQADPSYAMACETIRKLRAELEAIRGQQPDAVSVPRDLAERVSALFPLDMDDDGSGRAGFYPHVRETVRDFRALLSTKNAGEE